MAHRWAAVGLLLIACDQATKAAAVLHLNAEQVMPLLGSWAGLSLRYNEAFVYGIGADLPGIQLLTVIATLAVLGLVSWLYLAKLRTHYDPLRTALFMVLVVSGAVGNLLDRLVLGYIRDFLQLRWLGTVNLADIYTCAGLVMLVIALRRKRTGQRTGSP